MYALESMAARFRPWVIGFALMSCAPSTQHAADPAVTPGAPGNWHVMIGARSQKVSAASLGLPQELAVQPGLLWLLLGTVTYPLVKQAGSTDVELLSPAKHAPDADSISVQVPSGFLDERVPHALSSEHPNGSLYSTSIPVALIVDDQLRPSLQGALRKTFASTYLTVRLVAEKDCPPAVPSEFTIVTNACFLEAKSCETTAGLGDRTLKLGPFELDVLVRVGICVEARAAAEM